MRIEIELLRLFADTSLQRALDRPNKVERLTTLSRAADEVLPAPGSHFCSLRDYPQASIISSYLSAGGFPVGSRASLLT